MGNTSSINDIAKMQQIFDSKIKKDKSNRKVGELDKNDFLNLLVTQLKNQDPLNPTDNEQFIAQMSQFTALEQMQNLNTSFTMIKALNFVGKNVTAIGGDGKSSNCETVNGKVTGVKVNEGKVLLQIGEKEVFVDSVTGVSDEKNEGGSVTGASNEENKGG